MKRRMQVLAGIGAVALLCGALAAPSGAKSAPASCKKATNIEAIVDDSISMEFTDPNRLRVEAMDLLIDTLDPSTRLGAVEFGSELGEKPAADTVFAPAPVGPGAASMRSELDTKIRADNGATDYNSAFAQSDADNPAADARIFLTDGGHDVGDYTEGHLNHKVPTYVIGFSSGVASPEDQARLKKIAADTGGQYFAPDDASQLQSVMNSVEAALTCQTPPRQFTDQLAQGQSKPHSLAIGAATKAIQITLTWASPLDKFKLSGLQLTGKGGPIAIAPRPHEVGKLKVTESVSSTFAVFKVSHLKKGTLHFAVRAAKVGSGVPKATITTQVSQSARR